MPIITFILLACSVYLIYLSVKMKTTGKLEKNLVNPKLNTSRAKDIPGYIQYIYVRGIIAGVITLIGSLLMIYCDYYPVDYWLSLTSQVIYFIGIVYYGVVSVRGQKKYLI